MKTRLSQYSETGKDASMAADCIRISPITDFFPVKSVPSIPHLGIGRANFKAPIEPALCGKGEKNHPRFIFPD